jgi:anti-sigma factor RsiW
MREQCQQLEETFLHAYVDGEFGAEETAEVQAHLVACPVCTHAVRIHQSYRAAMSRASVHLAPQSLAGAIHLQLVEEAPDSRWTTAFRDPRGIALTAACVGAAAWFLAGGMSHSVLSHGTSLDDQVSLHAHAMPLDITASDVGTAQQWLSSKLDFGVRLPRFAQGTELQGARLANVHSRQAAVVTYAMVGGARRVSLVIADDPEPQLGERARQIGSREVFVTHTRGFNVVSWRSNEVVYSLISDLDERDVLALVQSAEQR